MPTSIIPRRAAQTVREALADTRVVLVNGARQAGKSTLVRAVAGEQAAQRRDLDRPQDRQSATADPAGFVAFGELMVIDEVQRAPELLLAIKVAVRRPTTRSIPAHRQLTAARNARPAGHSRRADRDDRAVAVLPG